MPYSADSVPSHVPQSKADQWASVWNAVYEKTMEDGDKSTAEAEARAFSAANALLSKRSSSLSVDNFVSFTDQDGVRRQGQIVARIDLDELGDGDGDAIKDDVIFGTDDAESVLEVQLYKPKRDGWEAGEEKIKVGESKLIKIESLPAPSRVSRKTPGGSPLENDNIDQVIKAAVRAALDTMKAYVPDGSRFQVKRLGENRLGGYALVHGSPTERDVEGDYFTKNTDLWLDVYSNQPLMFDHAVGVELPPDDDGNDEQTPRRYRLGSIVKAKRDDIGLWVEGVVSTHNKWVEGIWDLIDRGALYFSSGSVPHLIKRSEGGEVLSWPIIEVSTTPTPAEPRRTEVRSLAGAGKSSDWTEMLGGSQRTFTSMAEGSTSHMKHIDNVNHGGSKMTMKNKEAQQRLSGLLTALWSDELEQAIKSYVVTRRQFAVKQAENEEILPEEEEEVVAVASQLEQLLAPISEQAKSALGLDAKRVTKTLVKMALRKIAKQAGLEDEEDYLESEDEEEEDYMSSGDFDFLSFDEDYIDMDDDYLEFGEEEEEDFLEFGEEEEEFETLSGWPSYGRRGRGRRTFRSATPSFTRMVDDVVMREMNRLPSGRRGGYATKNVQIMRRSHNEATSLTGFLKAVRDKDHAKLRGYKARAESSYKALGINPDTAGGYLVPPEQSNEIIELLRAKSVFLRAEGGPEAQAESLVTVLPLNRDTLNIPRQTGAATAYWTAENATMTASQQTVGQIQLVAKKLTCLVKLSNELLADASVDMDNFVRADMAQVMALKVDNAVMYGSGIASEPLGVDAYPGLTKTALNAAPTYSNLVNLVKTIEIANVEEDDSWKWLFHPRDKHAFSKLKDTAGQYIFRNTGALNALQGAVPELLLGYPYMTTTQVDKTGSPEETDVFFGRWRDVILGMRQTIEVMASDVAGTSFEADQTWIRAILRMDIQMRHPESIAMYTDVREVA